MSVNEAFHTLIGHGSHGILWWQMSIRAIFIFLYGVLLIRLFGRRAFGKQNPLDIVLAIIIGSDLSRALTGNAPFLPTLAATAVIVLVFWAFEHLAARSHFVGWIMKGSPVRLMRDGAFDRHAMRRSGVSAGDVEEAGRDSGIAGMSGIREAVYERSGKINALSDSSAPEERRR